jgi:hypothetical protein
VPRRWPPKVITMVDGKENHVNQKSEMETNGKCLECFAIRACGGPTSSARASGILSVVVKRKLYAYDIDSLSLRITYKRLLLSIREPPAIGGALLQCKVPFDRVWRWPRGCRFGRRSLRNHGAWLPLVQRCCRAKLHRAQIGPPHCALDEFFSAPCAPSPNHHVWNGGARCNALTLLKRGRRRGLRQLGQ